MATVLQTQLVQGTVVSSSILLPTPTTHLSTATALLTARDAADSTFALVLMLQASMEPGFWRPVATVEWQGGGTASPVVQRT